MVNNWDDWKRLQHLMEFEGWVISDDKLYEVATQYEESGAGSLAARIAPETEESRKPLAEVAERILREFRERCGL